MAFRKSILFALLFSLFFNVSKAQYVTIPDTNFVNYLNTFGYGSCMSGNMLDTTCSLIFTPTILYMQSQNIMDLTGIKYFKNLEYLDCEDNLLSTLPEFSSKMKFIYCNHNNLTVISSLPDSLIEFSCENNQLTNLPTLPANLELLYCGFNQLSNLPILPFSLKFLAYQYNQINNFPVLPNGLTQLICTGNSVSTIPSLPPSLIDFSCDINLLTSLPTLPSLLIDFSCSDNLLTSLPNLPGTIITMNCNGNLLTTLPILPAGIKNLQCSNNLLTTLPALPDTMLNLNISNNLMLTCLPPISCIGWDNSGGEFFWHNTGIVCFPNSIFVDGSSPSIANIPICDVININNCSVNWNLKGTIGNDTNGNCVIDSIEPKLGNIKLNLFQSGNLVQHTYSNQIGQFSFTTDTGNFECVVDTNGTAYSVQCPVPFSYSASILSALSYYDSLDFSIQCKPNFDIGISTAKLDSGIFRPANFGIVSIAAGDMSSP